MSVPESAAEASHEYRIGSTHGTGAHGEHASLPPLYHDRSFWGMTLTQFLGAFNDNLFKQLVLLLSIIPAAGAIAAGEDAEDRQGVANIIFAVPFILTTGFAGFLSDRYGKRGIVVICKVAEIVVMGAGAVAFIMYARMEGAPPQMRLLGLYVVLFFMAAQSGFFGPAKYGILPEMLRPSDLPRANGLMLTTTFVAIILGQFLAGILLEYFPGQLWVGSTTCVAIAVVGTLTSLWVRKLPPAVPNLKFEPSALVVPTDMRALLRRDRLLLMAVLVSSVFWMLAGMVTPAVNALGKIEHGVGNDQTSYLLAIVSVGIAIGGALGGVLSGGNVDFRVLRIGAFGMLASLVLLGVPTWGAADERPVMESAAAGNARETEIAPSGDLPGIGESPQLLGYLGSMAVLMVLGVFTGFFAIPLQVYMQSRPPDDKKGRMIAVMNLANWIGIVLSGVLYSALVAVIEGLRWPRCTMFLFISMLMLPIALLYHPKSETLGDKEP